MSLRYLPKCSLHQWNSITIWASNKFVHQHNLTNMILCLRRRPALWNHCHRFPIKLKICSLQHCKSDCYKKAPYTNFALLQNPCKASYFLPCTFSARSIVSSFLVQKLPQCTHKYFGKIRRGSAGHAVLQLWSGAYSGALLTNAEKVIMITWAPQQISEISRPYSSLLEHSK